MQFLKPFASPASILAPGSCQAVRLTASLLAGAAPGPALSPEVEAEKQAAYARSRAAWRELTCLRLTASARQAGWRAEGG